jgi:hypothetical protein
MGRWGARAAAITLGGLLAVVLGAGVAAAHVEVSADPPVEGASNAAVTFTAEAESPAAGIASISVALPAGITSADVHLTRAPDGWRLTPTADGYDVAGPAQPTGQEVIYTIVVNRLPDVASLTFKTVVTYANGDADHWIDVPTTAAPNPDHPAPVLRLEPGTPGSSPTSPSPAPSVTSTPAAAPGPPDTSWWMFLVFAAVALAAIAAVAAVARRRGKL